MFQLFTFLLLSGFSIALFAQETTYALYEPISEQGQAASAKQDYAIAIATLESFIKEHPRYSLAYLEQSMYAIKNRDVALLKRNLSALKRQQITLPLDLLLTGHN